MDASVEKDLDWARLGGMISEARRRKGWDQQELARRSGNSPNTISNYERGRSTKSRRIPTGVNRVEQALGWPAGTAFEILTGYSDRDFDQAVLPLDVTKEQEAAVPSPAAHPRVGLAGARDTELMQSGHLAQDIFMRQAKRYRELRELSVEQLAAKLAGKEPALSEGDIRRLEDGTRLLRMAEATAIAAALDTTVDWLLGSGFSEDAPEAMRWPPNAEELQAEANAVLRRVADVGMQVNAANQQLAAAQQRMLQAQQESAMAETMLQSAMAQQREMEKHYQYLLGRIDSIRAARGEETVIQVHPVYESEEASDEAKAYPRPTHTASGDKAGTPYPGSKTEQRARNEAATEAARKMI